MSGHLCPDCSICPACGRSAWCEGDRILAIPCAHHGFCGEDNLTECTDCQADAEAELTADDITTALDRALAAFDGDPFKRPSDNTDPWGPLADIEREANGRFWDTVGDRSHLMKDDTA